MSRKKILCRAISLSLAAVLSATCLVGCRQEPAEDPEIDLGKSDVPHVVTGDGIYVEDDEGEFSTPDDPEPPDAPDHVVDKLGPSETYTYGRIADAFREDGNVAFSPLSLKLALGMAANGGTDAMKANLEEYLFNMPLDEFNQWVGALMQGLPDTVQIANGMFVNVGRTPVSDMRDVLAQYYSAGVQTLDFTSQSAVDAVNAWCAENTNGLIPELVKRLDGYQTLLVDALYFKQDWAEVVKDSAVYQEDFTNADGTVSTPDTMHFEADGYRRMDAADAFVKFYEGDRYCFVGLLPTRTTDDVSLRDMPWDLATQIDEYTFDDNWISMPEFKFESTLALSEAMSGTVLGGIFEEGAFPNVVEETASTIDEILQKVVVDVNREGTEAAAVTGILMTDAMAPAPSSMFELELDRPFAFMIYDREAKVILFMGAVRQL